MEYNYLQTETTVREVSKDHKEGGFDHLGATKWAQNPLSEIAAWYSSRVEFRHRAMLEIFGIISISRRVSASGGSKHSYVTDKK